MTMHFFAKVTQFSEINFTRAGANMLLETGMNNLFAGRPISKYLKVVQAGQSLSSILFERINTF